jgi:electron transport complex, rnfABCDGE type, G subunit
MKGNAKDILFSAGALTIIGAVVTAALAGTNLLTKDTIARRSEEAANAARRQVIEADSFEERTKFYGIEQATYYVTYYAAIRDGETVGYVFTADATGKSSGLVVMTGISTDGVITGVAVTEENETAGYVDKVTGAGLLEAFRGKEAAPLTLGEDVDGVSQATKTSKGIADGVNQAIAVYNALKEGGGTL